MSNNRNVVPLDEAVEIPCDIPSDPALNTMDNAGPTDYCGFCTEGTSPDPETDDEAALIYMDWKDDEIEDTQVCPTCGRLYEPCTDPVGRPSKSYQGKKVTLD